MHPDIAVDIARGRIDDLHRDAARHRLARAATRRGPTRPAFSDALGQLRAVTAGWVAARTHRTEPACCPA